MMGHLKKLGLGAGLAAMTLAMSAPAEARDRWRDDRGDNAAIAIGAGLVGLAIGAALADRDDDRYYDRRHYPSRRYVRVRGYPDYYYYYDGYPNRYYRDRYYSRYYQPYYRDHYDRRYRNRWDRGYNRVERWYGRDRDRRDHYRDHDRRRWRD